MKAWQGAGGILAWLKMEQDGEASALLRAASVLLPTGRRGESWATLQGCQLGQSAPSHTAQLLVLGDSRPPGLCRKLGTGLAPGRGGEETLIQWDKSPEDRPSFAQPQDPGSSKVKGSWAGGATRVPVQESKALAIPKQRPCLPGALAPGP